MTHREEFVLLSDDANPLKIVERTEFTLVCEAVRPFDVHATDGVTFGGLDLGEVQDEVGLEDFPAKDIDDLERAVRLGADIIGVSFASPRLIKKVSQQIEAFSARESRRRTSLCPPRGPQPAPRPSVGSSAWATRLLR